MNNKKHEEYEKRIQKYVLTAIKRLVKHSGDSKWQEYIVRMSFLPIHVSINKRYRCSWAGTWADYNGWKKPKALYIDFSLDLFEEEHTIKFIREIVTHELAHCLDLMIRGFTCHDSFWKDLHKEEFGGTGYRIINEKDIPR